MIAITILAAGPAAADHVGARITHVAHRRALASPIRTEIAGQQQQECGHEHGSHRIHVTDRIEAQATQRLGGAVAEMPRHPAVGNFMHSDGEDDGNRCNRDCVEKRCGIHVQSRLGPAKALGNPGDYTMRPLAPVIETGADHLCPPAATSAHPPKDRRSYWARARSSRRRG